MNKDLIKYIEDGITITRNVNLTYTIFTIPTQHFRICELEELTPERFEEEIIKQKNFEKMENEMFKNLYLGKNEN